MIASSSDAAPTNPAPLKTSLNKSDWVARRDAHRSRMLPWVTDRVERSYCDAKHPVYDFLFTYYSLRPAHLLRWSPGADKELLDCVEEELDWPLDSVRTSCGYIIPSSSFPAHRYEYLTWALTYLTTIDSRPPVFYCYGLHEWAMLYRSPATRHSQVPLRVSCDEISRVVEVSELRCSHYDAYRFFTPEARPLNRSLLSRRATTDFDQPGCIHVTMDLYKFAHKISPWCPSDLVADAFILAAKAREIDMRASPYDLRAYGFSPIAIETDSGKAEYIVEQRCLSERAVPIRRRLIEVYSELLQVVSSGRC
jgi:hypothetical protein